MSTCIQRYLYTCMGVAWCCLLCAEGLLSKLLPEVEYGRRRRARQREAIARGEAGLCWDLDRAGVALAARAFIGGGVVRAARDEGAVAELQMLDLIHRSGGGRHRQKLLWRLGHPLGQRGVLRTDLHRRRRPRSGATPGLVLALEARRHVEDGAEELPVGALPRPRQAPRREERRELPHAGARRPRGQWLRQEGGASDRVILEVGEAIRVEEQLCLARVDGDVVSLRRDTTRGRCCSSSAPTASRTMRAPRSTHV